jgi:hypothetical protein
MSKIQDDAVHIEMLATLTAAEVAVVAFSEIFRRLPAACRWTSHARRTSRHSVPSYCSASGRPETPCGSRLTRGGCISARGWLRRVGSHEPEWTVR